MELRQLRYFVRIVDLGSLSKAAVDLYVAQPALSKQVAALESELKASLLVRSPRGVAPTEAGLAFYRQAQSVLRQLARVPDEVRSAAASPTGAVAVGMPFSASNILAPALVAAVRERLPGIRLAITQEGSGQLEGLLASGRLDLSLLYERTRPSPQIDEQPLLVEELFLVTRAPGGRGEVALADAARQRLILPGPLNSTRQVVEGAFAKAGLVLDLAAEVDVPWTMKAMVAAGLGATIVSRSALYPERAEDGLIARRIVRPVLTRALNLCTRRGETPARAGALVAETLAAAARGLIERGAWRGAVPARRRQA
ncbi:MAG TPA: LysR substrate-binding domain-containing protein [Burkholderiales bacterium]|nr:LysR substrate-binding domain-containing protein [Burkholderiales bacterium]